MSKTLEKSEGSDISAKRHKVSLDDKFEAREGRIYISGIQSLLRLALVQKWQDKKRGLDTAGFVSGYRGSPLGGIDGVMLSEGKRLKENDVVFQAGLNEAIAATSVRGTQEAKTFSKTAKDGIFGIWYGKAPGVDQAMDAIRHAHAAGTTDKGGVIAIAGDDHSASSSTIAAQTDMNFMAAGVPVLYPAAHDEFVAFGAYGVEMSRFTGGWVALKTTADTIEGSGTVDLSIENRNFVAPLDYDKPEGGLSMRRGDVNRFEQSDRVSEKLEAAKAFARANKINFPIFSNPKDKLGIIASGKAYRDVRQALYEMGIDEKEAENLGLRLYKVGMVYPLEDKGIEEFCEGLEHVLVVEEAKPIIEDQLKSLLFAKESRPSITGKSDKLGKAQFSTTQGFSPSQVTKVIAEHILDIHPEEEKIAKKLAYYKNRLEMTGTTGGVMRKAHFCSGCPHNASTKVPEGSRALGGIGCHIMAVWNYDRSTNEFSQMGGEGASWLGQAPFVDENHVFSNLGDGTYQHSGSLAIRANILAGHNITYKILYNDAVAMTGGQALEGGLDVDQIVAQMAGEGVKLENIVVVSEDPSRIKKMKLPKGVQIHDRKKMNEVQADMREKQGVSILIFDQGCAAEKRRKRKRGLIPTPDTSVIINSDICESCGDCSVKSSCVSIVPTETELGTKRSIDQTNCNKDNTCINGFCPSFITVKGELLAKGKKAEDIVDPALLNDIPEAACKDFDDHYNILIGGIGGTGVVTMSALLGMAAHIEGKEALAADLTGISQKGGAVFSHVRISKGEKAKGLWSSRIISGGADCLIACDDIVAASADMLDKTDPERTSAVVNIDLTPTLDFTQNRDFDFERQQTFNAIKINTKSGDCHAINLKKLAEKVSGSTTSANMFMLGYVYQKGLLPLDIKSIEEAITLNGVSVAENIEILKWGRLCAHKPEVIEQLLSEDKQEPVHYSKRSLDEIMSHRIALLTDYQSAAYASRYKDLVQRVKEAEENLGGHDLALTKAVAHNYAKVLAYKDEYEVARLHTTAEAKQRLQDEFAKGAKPSFHFAPPLLARKDKITGEPQKVTFGTWVLPLLNVMKRFKGLRGSWFDPFAYSADRKLERKIIDNYESDVNLIVTKLNKMTALHALNLAKIPEDIRGFGHVKESNYVQQQQKREALRKVFIKAMDVANENKYMAVPNLKVPKPSN